MARLTSLAQGIVSRVDPAVGWAISGIFGLLLVATLAVWLLGRVKPGLLHFLFYRVV